MAALLHRRFKRRSAAGVRGPAGLAAIALTAFGLVAAPATAADRYVTPAGIGSLCAQFSPCSLDAGINEAESGDTVHVAGDQGAYLGESALLEVPSGVSVIGEGAHLPRVVFGSTGTLSVSPGASVTRLDLSRASGEGAPLFVLVDGVASRLRIESPSGQVAQVFGLLRDSFAHSTIAGYQAITALGDAAKLHNVTAVADGVGAPAIRTESHFDYTSQKCKEEATVELRNVIARGAGSDLYAYAESLSEQYPCPAIFDVGHSNYRSSAVTLLGDGGAELLDQGGNQTGVEPLLAPDRLHQLAGSPTIDAGIAASENGPADLDGEPRTQGAAPDIGVDEFPTTPLAPDTTAPVGSKLRFKPRRFRPKRKRAPSIAGTSAKKRRKRSPRISRVSYRLSEDAAVRWTVYRYVLGFEKTFGKTKRCVVGKRARHPRKAKKCKKLVRVKGAFTHTGMQGANRFRFTGYIKGRRLMPGAYRMVGVPTDAAGNRGRRFGGSFAIEKVEIEG